MQNLTDYPIMRWRIRCQNVECQWQTQIVALQPFTHQKQSISSDELILGFWEDYICPVHLEVQRREVIIDTVGVPLDEAYYRYVTGQIQTTPVPLCSICQQRMQGGRVLESLPFAYQSTLAVLQWLSGELKRLQYSIDIDIYSQLEDKVSSLRRIALDFGTLENLYNIMCQKFDTNRSVVPLLNTKNATLDDWQKMLIENLEVLEKSKRKLLARQAQETHKTPAMCPICHQHTVYLVEATTI